MKRWIICFVSFLLFAPVLAASMYLATEKKYGFTVENLSQTIPEFVQDENKQSAVAEKWQDLMDPETGNVSIADLFTVCRTGGFNTYRAEGFSQCRSFINKLLENAQLELDEDSLDGFCPGLDEKGKNPNALSTITDKTQIGSFCSSTNIAGGEVVFRKGYNCTCLAYACNQGFESKGGACIKIVADENGNCLRKEYKNVDGLKNGNDALKFCEGKSVSGCKVVNAINNFNSVKGTVVCNATQEEFLRVKSDMLKRADQKIASLKYYEVCGKDAGKTGKKEHCVEMFKDADVGLNEAVGLAEVYALEKHKLKIHCAPKDYRQESNDDYIKCANVDKTDYYEFRFDDVTETSDIKKREDLFKAFLLVYGINKKGGAPNYHFQGKCPENLKKGVEKFGWKATYFDKVVGWPGDYCNLYPAHMVNQSNMAEKVHQIEGLNSNVTDKIQLQGSTNLRNQLKSYIEKQGFVVTAFECDRAYGAVYNKGLSGNDDILTCHVSGKFNGQTYKDQPIDFIFDDVSEGKKKTREAGEQGMQCITADGKFDGIHCRGLTKEECFALETEMLKQGVKSWDGSTDLVDWDEGAQACELNAARFVSNMNKVGKYTAIAGLTVAGVFTGGTTMAAAVSLMAVELAGMAGEIYTERKKETLPQEWADKFLAASIVCKKPSCAESTLRSNFGKIQQASDMLNRDVLAAVDEEMARLATMIPDSRLEEIMSNPKAPNCWETWECQSYVFTFMQMASLATAVGKGLVKLTGVMSAKMGAAAAKNSTKALALTAGHADDAGKLLLTAGNNADDAGRLLLTAGDNADDAGRLLLTAGNNADDGGRLLLTAGNNADDAERLLLTAGTRSDDVAAAAAKKSLKEELEDIGVREVSSYQDIRTGNFVSREEVLSRIDNMPGGTGATKSTVEELREIGIREVKSHQDIRTGNFISNNEVLRRIDDMGSVAGESGNSGRILADMADEADDILATGGRVSGETYNAPEAFSKQFSQDFEQIGVREIRDRNGVLRYQDITNNNNFISRQAILERIYGSPKVTETVTTGAEDMWRAGTSAGNAGRTSSAASGAADATQNAARSATSQVNNAASGIAGATRSAENIAYDASKAANAPSEVLSKWGLTPQSTVEEIRARYRQLANVYHPDRVGGNSAIMSMINEEADVLRKIGMLK